MRNRTNRVFDSLMSPNRTHRRRPSGRRFSAACRILVDLSRKSTAYDSITAAIAPHPWTLYPRKLSTPIAHRPASPLTSPTRRFCCLAGTDHVFPAGDAGWAFLPLQVNGQTQQKEGACLFSRSYPIVLADQGAPLLTRLRAFLYSPGGLRPACDGCAAMGPLRSRAIPPEKTGERRCRS